MSRVIAKPQPQKPTHQTASIPTADMSNWHFSVLGGVQPIWHPTIFTNNMIGGVTTDGQGFLDNNGSITMGATGLNACDAYAQQASGQTVEARSPLGNFTVWGDGHNNYLSTQQSPNQHVLIQAPKGVSDFGVCAVNDSKQMIGHGVLNGTFTSFLVGSDGKVTDLTIATSQTTEMATINGSSLHVPERMTFARGINDAGVVAGDFVDQAGNNHGFIWDAQHGAQLFDFPGAKQTYITGITTNDIIGYTTDAPTAMTTGAQTHTFVAQKDSFFGLGQHV